MKIAGLIPARYGSSRFPGKPLVDIGGKTMIRRVYEQVLKTKSIDRAIVATDHTRIMAEVESFGGEAIMTSPTHTSGTERCAEVIQKLDEEFQVIINIQGDEPFIDPDQIDMLANMFLEDNVEIATLSKKITDVSDITNINVVKVVVGNNNQALYFSRSPIPFLRGKEVEKWIHNFTFYKHIGIYGYRDKALNKIVKLLPGKLEQAESLEQLRWLENGFSIFVKETTSESISIDTPDDLKKTSTFIY